MACNEMRQKTCARGAHNKRIERTKQRSILTVQTTFIYRASILVLKCGFHTVGVC